MDELTKIVSGAILNIVVGILGLLFVHYLQGLLQSHSARGGGNNTGPQNDKLDAKNISTIALGFTVAVVASFFWGAGNAVSRYTLTQISEHSRYQAVVDVALIQYVGATSLILLIAFVCALFSKEQKRLQRPLFAKSWGKFFVATFFKGASAYVWIASLVFITAGPAATLQNLHILWTALFIAIIGNVAMPKSWVAGAVVILVGTVLILRWNSLDAVALLTPASLAGYGLAILAGLTYSLFIISWSMVGERPPGLTQRVFETGIFMLVSGVMILLLHLAISPFLFHEHVQLFQHLPPFHMLVQFINGGLSTGMTYLLVNEALKLLSRSGVFASLLLSLGVSYAVLFTTITESVLMGISLSLTQWLGLLLFSVGFASVRHGVDESDT